MKASSDQLDSGQQKAFSSLLTKYQSVGIRQEEGRHCSTMC